MHDGLPLWPPLRAHHMQGGTWEGNGSPHLPHNSHLEEFGFGPFEPFTAESGGCLVLGLGLYAQPHRRGSPTPVLSSLLGFFSVPL